MKFIWKIIDVDGGQRLQKPTGARSMVHRPDASKALARSVKASIAAWTRNNWTVGEPVYTATGCTVEATPPGDKMQLVTSYMPPEMWAACVEMAEEKGTTASDVVRMAVKEYLAK